MIHTKATTTTIQVPAIIDDVDRLNSHILTLCELAHRLNDAELSQWLIDLRGILDHLDGQLPDHIEEAKDVPIRLVFDDWRGPDNCSVYATEAGIQLSLGSFHSGTRFEATIDLDEEDAADLRQALASGYRPVFWIPEIPRLRGERREPQNLDDLTSPDLPPLWEEPQELQARLAAHPDNGRCGWWHVSGIRHEALIQNAASAGEAVQRAMAAGKIGDWEHPDARFLGEDLARGVF